MEIITGYVGKPHVTAEQDRDINQGIIGSGSYVLQTGMGMAAEVSSNNEVKIRDGVIIHQGCAASIKKNAYDQLTIMNGSQGMKRIDLIVARYERNNDTRVESMKLIVLQGTPDESSPTVPKYATGDIQAGDIVADMPMYQVIIDGLNITEVKKVFETAPDISTMKKEISELSSKTIKYEIVPIVSGLSVGANTMLRQGVISEADLNKYLSKNKATKYIGFCTLDGGYGDQMQVTFTMYNKSLYCQVDNRHAANLTIYPSVCMLMV